MKPRLSDATDHFGIIAKLSFRYWKLLPPHVRSFFDVEDMISEVTLQVVIASQKYSPRRGRPSTFVHNVAENHCHTIVGKHKLKKRLATEVIPLELLGPRLVSPSEALLWRESRMAVEKILADASFNLRNALEAFLSVRQIKRIHRCDIEELKLLVRKHGVTYQNLHFVLNRI